MEEIKKYTCKCQNCNREFDEEEYQITQDENKCILHCSKDDSSDTKINLFWKKFSNFINEKINNESKEIVLDKIKFAPKCNSGDDNFPKIPMFKIKFLIFKDCIFLDCIDLTPFFSAKNLEITNCTFHENVDIQTIIHQEQFVFQKNSVLKEIKFFNIEFKSICFFVENSINKLTVEGVRFYDNAIFSNSKIEDLFFKNTFFIKESNFLDIKLLKVRNRETARIIKDSFEQQNNIIEANKFYALEMKEREKELNPKKDFFEWLVFKTHGLVSNHSQDWILALFWIISLTFITSFIKIIDSNISLITEKIVLSFIVTAIVLFININISNTKKIYYVICSLVYYFLYSIFTKDFSLNIFSNTLNPFSIMTGKEELTFGILLYKITIAYLIYQLIISIRQNTRRK